MSSTERVLTSELAYYANIDADDENSLRRFDEQNGFDNPETLPIVALCGFLELAIHHLLYVKNVYPKIVFKSILRNNIKIWTCRHPGVRKYILDFLDLAHQLLLQEKSLKICFVLKRLSGKILERYYFYLKVHGLVVNSRDEMVRVVDNLLRICEDIEKNNTFCDFNTIDKGQDEIIFELQIRISPPSLFPKVTQDYPWMICLESEGDADVDTEGKKRPNYDKRNVYEVSAFTCMEE
ncbi:hypothetical protein NPIL_422451 [Nephila pilipes]|uniref:HORMA domain-containing protein n=1 Tax=Nephila pilipes TaxID=299642 RepID=A0A8X6QDZ2_NEPPI|nr:hypothetical protein NPIL_422451 [Nephila pilipes]